MNTMNDYQPQHWLRTLERFAPLIIGVLVVLLIAVGVGWCVSVINDAVAEFQTITQEPRP